MPNGRTAVAAAARLSRTLIATLLLLCAELVVVAITSWEQFVGLWELTTGTLRLLPILLALAALVSVVSTLLWARLEAGDERGARLQLTAASALFAGAVSWGVGGGRHLASLGARGGFALAAALASALVCFALAPRLAGLIARRPRSVGLLSLALVVCTELVNRFVLVRLYPAFHVGLALLSLLLVPGALLALPERATGEGPPRRWRRALLAATALAAAGLAKPAAEQLAYFDNYRLLMAEHAPLLGQGVQLASRLAPPPELPPDDACADFDASCAPAAATTPASASLDLRGRDLLLITIDALRADHLGAYGYARKITPNMDALAARGALFEHAYAPTPHTSYSITSLMTGKYMRPLLLQGIGQDSDTWAGLLRTYAYRTAAFYPPAVFFIDSSRFESFSAKFLGFEYRKVEFLEGERRVLQVEKYLKRQSRSQRVFIWVHLFGPHEPYEVQPGFDYGPRDLDRYDSEVARADQTVGELVRLFERERPSSAVIVSADHGEEFGEHGGRYHGTTVYEEQVRVPLIVAAPRAILPRRIPEPVQTIDLLPTVLASLQIPRPPRLRGRDLSALLAGQAKPGDGFAAAETEEQSLLAQGNFRLICARKLGACKLYDLAADPAQTRDISREQPARFQSLRDQQRKLSASHGRYEQRGLRAEGKGWPEAILRGVAGEGDAAEEIAALLDDADVTIRRKAAELLLELGRRESAPALRLALARDEDLDVRRYSALALTKLGEPAPLTLELARSTDTKWRRLAALALALGKEPQGEATLIEWWKDEPARDYARSRELLEAFSRIRSRAAVEPLLASLDDVRLRPFIADALAAIGDTRARLPLAVALGHERYQSARVALTRALVALGARAELVQPLRRFLGVPDPLPGGLAFAQAAGILQLVGGPPAQDLERLQRASGAAAVVRCTVPLRGKESPLRVLVRVANTSSGPATIRLSAANKLNQYSKSDRITAGTETDAGSDSVAITVPPGGARELHARLPAGVLEARSGSTLQLHVLVDAGLQVEALAVVPLAEELPPPAPEPWQSTQDDEVQSDAGSDAQ